MIILTKKKQDRILQKICANEVIVRSFISQCDGTKENIEAIGFYADNAGDIAYSIGGIKGLRKVFAYIEEKEGRKLYEAPGESKDA